MKNFVGEMIVGEQKLYDVLLFNLEIKYDL